MKKKFFGFCAAVCLFLTLVCPAFAAESSFDANQVPFDTMVWDSAGILTVSQADKLTARAWELTQEYQCAVYIVTLPHLAGLEAWDANEFIVEEYGLGYGPDQNCVVLLLSMEEREYDIAAHGYGNVAFTDYGKEKMAEHFLDEFGDDNWYGGFTEYLNCCANYLKLASEGEPFDVGSDRSPLIGLAIGIIVPLGVAFLVCSYFKSQMKTAQLQKAAQVYIDRQGLVLTGQNDRFIHTTRSERYIEPPKSSGGTSENSSGFSHSSGSF